MADVLVFTLLVLFSGAAANTSTAIVSDTNTGTASVNATAAAAAAAAASDALQQTEDGQQVSFTGYQVLRVSVTTNNTVNLLQRYEDVPGVDFWTPPSPASGTVDVMLSPEIRSNFTRQLNSSGVSYAVSIADVQAVAEEQRRHLPGPDRGQDSARQDHQLTWKAYHRLADHHQYLDYVARAHPELCQSFSIGTSSEGRDLRVAKCGTGAREVWIDGGVHAREWISPAVVSYLVREFSENSSRSQDILEEFTIYFLPVLNPDGYEYSHTSTTSFLEKNTLHNQFILLPRRRCQSYFKIRWGMVGTSNNPCSHVYGGPRPFSEPETAAVKRFLLSHTDNMEMYISFHSYGQMLFVPYGFGLERPADYNELLRVAALGAEAVAATGGPRYQIGQPSRIMYPASGVSQDWAKAIADIKYSFTFELRDTGYYGFLLPASFIEQSGAEIFAGVQAMIRTIA